MQTATEFHVIDFDEKGFPSIASISERDAELYYKVYDFLIGNEHVYGEPNYDASDFRKIFIGDRSLFLCDVLRGTEELRDMQSDFGIVPLPKRDEQQEKYHSQIGTSSSMNFIPTTTTDVNRTAMFCEACAYYSSKNVIPAYYEVALKDKYSRDSDVREMLDIIRDSAQMDFTYAYSTLFLPYINEMLPTCLTNKKPDIASEYAKNLKRWNATMEKLVSGFVEKE